MHLFFNTQPFMATVETMTPFAHCINNLAYSLERQPFSVPSQLFKVQSEIRTKTVVI